MRIIAHLGIQLSPPPSFPAPTPYHVGVDTTDLESKRFAFSDSEGGDDLGSEGESPPRDEPATATHDSDSDDLDATKSESD